MKTAVIVAFDNFTDIDVFLAWDFLNRVKLINKDFQVKIIGTQRSHQSVNGIDLKMNGSIEDCNNADIVFFSSGPGARQVIKDVNYLQRFKLNPEKQLICSMCSGALIIAALGHLKNLSATTYPTAFEALKKYDVNVIENTHLVIQGNIATAAGCLAAVDLIGWVIKKTFNTETSEKVIAYVLPIGQGQKCMY